MNCARFVLSIAAFSLLAGCGQKPQAAAQGAGVPAAGGDQAARDINLPKVPGIDDNAGAMDDVIKKPAAERKLDKGYESDEKMTGGTLKAAARFTSPVKRPPDRQVDTSAVVKDPQDREHEYYKNFKYFEPNYAGHPHDGGLVTGAVIYIRGIKRGKRAAFDRPLYRVYNGLLNAPYYYMFGGNYNFAMLSDRLQIRNNDPFDASLVLKAPSGKALYEEIVPKQTNKANGMIGEFDAWNKHLEPGGSSVLTGWWNSSKIHLTPSLKELGIYELSCKRHTWQKAWLAVVDNPYVAVLHGRCVLDGIPPGRHTVEVWHALYEPVKKSVEIEIKENEATEVAFEFTAPAGSEEKKEKK